MKYFEDATIGESIVFPQSYRLTEENIIAMGTEWDPIPIHTDAEAAKASIFGGLVASTVHLFAIATRLSRSGKDEWAVVSSLGMSDFKNHAPGYAGDVLQGRNTFTAKRVSRSKPDKGVVDYRCELHNQDGKILFEFFGAALYTLKGNKAVTSGGT
jgi:acyl dehydratase